MSRVVLISVLIASLGCTFAEVDLGPFFECAHSLKGRVFAKNEREMVIRGFHYDGKGPAAWFHGQKKGAKGVYTSDEDYVTLPYPEAKCDRLEVGRAYKNEEITVILPDSIKNYETFGVYCYEFCHNFGHIVVNSSLEIPPAPATIAKTTACPKPAYKACTLAQSENSDIVLNCKPESAQMNMMNTEKMPNDDVETTTQQ